MSGPWLDQVEVNRENYRRYLDKFEESRMSDAMDAKPMAESPINSAGSDHAPLNGVWKPALIVMISRAIF